MFKAAIYSIICVAIAFNYGCGTTVTLQNSEKFESLIYSGVREDYKMLGEFGGDDGFFPQVGRIILFLPINLFFLIDLPLSMIADTVMLPYTIPKSSSEDSPSQTVRPGRLPHPSVDGQHQEPAQKEQ